MGVGDSAYWMVDHNSLGMLHAPPPELPMIPSIDTLITDLLSVDGDEANTSVLVDSLALACTSSSTGMARLVERLESRLTSDTVLDRVKSTALLCEVVRCVGKGALERKQASTLIEFFVGRYESDWECALGCLRGVLALVRNQGEKTFFGEGGRELAKMVLTKVLKAHFVNDLTQPLRALVFEITQALLGLSGNVVHGDFAGLKLVEQDAEDAWFTKLFRDAMEGEKDPRCLLVCLAILEVSLSRPELGGDDFVEDAFELASAYFPITFIPPPNDPFGITHEALVDGLNSVFCATKTMAFCVFPMVLERLKTTSSEASSARVEALRLISFCATKFDAKGVAPFLVDLRDVIVGLVLSPDEDEHADEALTALKAIVRLLAPRAVVNSEPDELWEEFTLVTLRRCGMALETAIDSMAARGAARIIVAVCDSCATGFSTALKGLVPMCETFFKRSADAETPLSSTKIVAALELIRNVVKCVDPQVCYSTGHAPMEPYASRLFAAVENCARRRVLELEELEKNPLRESWISRSGDEEAESDRRIVILDCLITKDLVCRTDRPFVSEDDIREAAEFRVAHVLIPTLQRSSVSTPRLDLLGACVVSLRDFDSRKNIGVLNDVLLPALMDQAETTLSSTHFDERGGSFKEKANLVLSSFPVLCEDSNVASLLVAKRIVSFLTELNIKYPNSSASTLTRVASSIKDSNTLEECFAIRDADNVLEKFCPETLAVVTEKCSLAGNEKLVRLAINRLAQTKQIDRTTEAVLLTMRRDYSFVLKPCTDVLFAECADGNVSDVVLRVVCCAINKSPADTADHHELSETVSRLFAEIGFSRIDRVRVLSGVFKALCLRACFDLAEPLGSFLQWSLQDDVVAPYAVRAFSNLVVDNVEDGLNVPFVRASGVAKQRAFDTWFRRLRQDDRSNGSRAALVGLASGSPKRGMLGEEFLNDVVPTLIRVCSNTSPDEVTQSSAIKLFKVVLEEDPERLAQHLSVCVPFLLKVCCPDKGAVTGAAAPSVRDKLDALDALTALPNSLAYHQLHPYRGMISKRLGVGALDDDRRIVRKGAVKCRELWMTFSSS